MYNDVTKIDFKYSVIHFKEKKFLKFIVGYTPYIRQIQFVDNYHNRCAATAYVEFAINITLLKITMIWYDNIRSFYIEFSICIAVTSIIQT